MCFPRERGSQRPAAARVPARRADLPATAHRVAPEPRLRARVRATHGDEPRHGAAALARGAGSGPAVVRKFLLTEDGSFTVPPGLVVLHSEIVIDSNNTEVLEVWAAVPVSNSYSSSNQNEVHNSNNLEVQKPAAPQTIYTNTVIYEDDLEGFNPNLAEEDDEFYY